MEPIEGSGDDEHADTAAAVRSAKITGDLGVCVSAIGFTLKAVESELWAE